MSSDNADKNIVLTVFVMFFIYLAYIREKLNVMQDWSNLKCNPLYLFVSSFILSNNDSINNFSRCVNNIATNAVNNGLNESKRNQLMLSNKISQFQNDIDLSYSAMNSNIRSINTSYNNLSTKLDTVIKNQNTNNDTMNNYKNNTMLNGFTTKINDIFTNITNYLPSIK